jgi:hypothetical protein
MKPLKIVQRGDEKMYFEGGEFDQSTLYACMEISQ